MTAPVHEMPVEQPDQELLDDQTATTGATRNLSQELVDQVVDQVAGPAPRQNQRPIPNALMGTVEIVRDATEWTSVDEWMSTDDLQEVDIRHPAWRIGGKQLTLRCKALDLETQEKILRTARIAAAEVAREQKDPNPPDRDWITYCVETVRLATIRPVLSRGQAKLIASKSAKAVEDYVNFIWGLGSLSRDYIESLVDQQTRGADAATD